MVTLIGLSDDDQRLLDAFDILLPAAKSAVLQRLSVAACYAALVRSGQAGPAPAPTSPEQATEAFLMRCRPRVPSGYRDDFGFEERYLDHALPAIRQRCIALVLGSAVQDSMHAAELADDLTGCAVRIASDFCAPDFTEEGFVDAGTVQAFIEEWRENFTTNLSRAAAKPGA